MGRVSAPPPDGRNEDGSACEHVRDQEAGLWNGHHCGMGVNHLALDALLEIVRRDRKWSDEAARKQLVQLFDAWGPKDPLTIDGRRRLSSVLFA